MFGGDDSKGGDDLAVGDFAPRPRGQGPRPDPDQVRQVAQAAGFTPREPADAAAPRQQRRHRTGRTEQINLRASPEYRDRFNALADQLQASQAEAFERAVEALEQKLKG